MSKLVSSRRDYFVKGVNALMGQSAKWQDMNYHPPVPAEAPISIKIATTKKEKERVYRFRYQVYVEEMGKLLSADADHKHRMLFDELDEWGILFYATVGRKIIGTMRLNVGSVNDFPPEYIEAFAMDKFQTFSCTSFPEHKLTFTSKTMVAPQYRRSQAFYLLSATLYETIRKIGGQFNFTGGAPHMVALYEQLGHRRYKSNFQIPDYGYMVPMVILMEDINHLRQVRSPMWRLARKFENSPESADWFTRTFPEATRYINKQMIDREMLLQLISDKLERQPNSINLFMGMSESEARLCAEVGHIFLCHQAETIIQPSDMSHEFFVVLSGCVAVRKRHGLKFRQTVLHSGQCFGERSFVTHSRHNVSVIAQTDTELLIMPRHGLERLQIQHPETAAKLLHNIGIRVSHTYNYA